MSAKKKAAKKPIHANPFGLDDLIALATKFEDIRDGTIGLDRVIGALPEIRALLALAETVRQHRDGERSSVARGHMIDASDGFNAYNIYEQLREDAKRRSGKAG